MGGGFKVGCRLHWLTVLLHGEHWHTSCDSQDVSTDDTLNYSQDMSEQSKNRQIFELSTQFVFSISHSLFLASFDYCGRVH